MSWSVSSAGDSAEVAKQIEDQFTHYSPMSEPEESIKESARLLIAKALAGNIPSRNVSVSAFGSQGVKYGSDGAPDEVYNSISITIT